MRTTRRRNVFPGEHFLTVPLRLYESGLAAQLSGSQFKRYITLLHPANYNYGQTNIKMDLEELEVLDAVSARTAFQAHTKLEEFGLIQINKNTKPATYTLWEPHLWKPLQQLKRDDFSERTESEWKLNLPLLHSRNLIKPAEERTSPSKREAVEP